MFQEAGLPQSLPDDGRYNALFALGMGVVRALYHEQERVDIEPQMGGLIQKALVIGPRFPPVHDEKNGISSYVVYAHLNGRAEDVVCWPVTFRSFLGPGEVMRQAQDPQTGAATTQAPVPTNTTAISSTTSAFPKASASNVALALPLIYAQAAQYNLDPNLVAAVAYHESNFDPHAVSSAGARGTMQLMPEIIKAFGVTDPFDVQQSLAGGMKLLRELSQAFPGDTASVISAYQAGPTKVKTRGALAASSVSAWYVPAILKTQQTLTNSQTTPVASATLPSAPDASAAAGDVPPRDQYARNLYGERIGDVTVRVTNEGQWVVDSATGDILTLDSQKRQVTVNAPTVLVGESDKSRISYKRDASIEVVAPKTRLESSTSLDIATPASSITSSDHANILSPSIHVGTMHGARIEYQDGRIVLNASEVKLGSVAASESLILGDSFLAFLNQFLVLYASHVHPGVTVGPTVTGPSAISPTFMDASLLSPLVRVARAGSGGTTGTASTSLGVALSTLGQGGTLSAEAIGAAVHGWSTALAQTQTTLDTVLAEGGLLEQLQATAIALDGDMLGHLEDLAALVQSPPMLAMLDTLGSLQGDQLSPLTEALASVQDGAGFDQVVTSLRQLPPGELDAVTTQLDTLTTSFEQLPALEQTVTHIQEAVAPLTGPARLPFDTVLHPLQQVLPGANGFQGTLMAVQDLFTRAETV